MAVNQGISHKVSTFFRIQDMHGSEVFIFRLDAYHFFCYFDGIGIFGIQTGDKCIGFSCFHHHHAEVVALEHLVV